MANQKYGYFEYGDVYAWDDANKTRGEYAGVLVIDQDNQRFYLRSEGKAATPIPHDRVNWMLANKLIEFYREDSESYLVDYMMRLDEHAKAVREAKRKELQGNRAAQSLKESEKLIKKTKSSSRKAKLFWLVGCMAIVALGVIMSIPEAEPAPATPSIAGEGMEYPIDQSLLKNSTYMTAIGNGAELYGIIMDDVIVESGQLNSNESPIKENILVNAGVSSTYPIHMRPLYYDRSNFYQSQVHLNDSDQGSSGIMLQNPNGYSLGYAANEIVFFGGKGMSSLVLNSPDPYVAKSAGETAREIEKAQEEAARIAERGESYGTTPRDPDDIADEMPEGWNGYDYADIDSHVVVGSYWYTKDSTLKKQDLRRRVVVWDITPVLNTGESGVDDMEPIQLNYADRESNFYNPVVSLSPSSNGSRYWIGYTKEDSQHNTGFFIRQYDDAEDVLKESYDNTFSTKDLTGVDFPITNYTLHGDRLFFEQQGYIWVIDLSKASLVVDGNQRTVKKENPIKICKSSEIRPTVTRDEKFLADQNHVTTVPVSHYQVVTMTTAGGMVEYGIAFIESDSGNLVFQPVNGAAVAAAELHAGQVDSSANDVYSGDEAALKKAQEEAAARNELKNSGSSSNQNTAANQNANANANANQSDAEESVPFAQTAYTMQIADDDASQGEGEAENTIVVEEGDADTGRILIKSGNPDMTIVCFTVRGEQFYWMEESTEDKTRHIMVSPIYYKNDASKIDSDMINTEGSGEETEETNGVQPSGDAGAGTVSTSPDVALGNNAQQDQNAEAIYWINFFKEGTREKIAESKPVKGHKVNEEVSEEAVGVGGWKLTSERHVTIKLTPDPTKNEINFFYKQQP